MGDPDEYTRIRTKQLGREGKGIKAHIGRYEGEGPRGGKTEVQSYMFDARRYTPEDAARWVEGHPTGDPLTIDVSPLEATDRRYKVYDPKPTRAKPKRKKVAKKAAARKKKPKKKRKLPPAAKRCTSKTQSGTCKGWRQAGKQKCSLHAQGLARKPKAKKKKARRRKAG